MKDTNLITQPPVVKIEYGKKTCYTKLIYEGEDGLTITLHMSHAWKNIAGVVIKKPDISPARALMNAIKADREEEEANDTERT